MPPEQERINPVIAYIFKRIRTFGVLRENIPDLIFLFDTIRFQ